MTHTSQLGGSECHPTAINAMTGLRNVSVLSTIGGQPCVRGIEGGALSSGLTAVDGELAEKRREGKEQWLGAWGLGHLGLVNCSASSRA